MIKKLTTLAAMLLTAAFIMEVPKVSAYDDREFIEKCGKRIGYDYLGTTEHGKEKQEMYDELYELCCEIWENDKDISYWKEVNVSEKDDSEKCWAYPYIKIYETDYDHLCDEAYMVFEVVNMLKFDNPVFYFLNEYVVRVDDDDDTNDYKPSPYYDDPDDAHADHYVMNEMDRYYYYGYDTCGYENIRFTEDEKYYIGVLAYEDYISGKDRAAINDEVYDYVTKTAAELDKKDTTYDKALLMHDKIITESKYDLRNSRSIYTHNILGVIQKHNAVCESFGEIFDLMMNYIGEDDILMQDCSHVWNLLNFEDGKYYFIDMTMDDVDDRFDDDPVDGDEPGYIFFKKGLNFFLNPVKYEKNGKTIFAYMHYIDKKKGQYVTQSFYPLPIDEIYSGIPGDLNNDTIVDIEDAVLILGFINGNNAFDDTETADIDHSGVIDISDAVSLIGYINGTIPIR